MGHQFQKHFYPDTEVADAVLPLPLPFSASLPSPSARPPACPPAEPRTPTSSPKREPEQDRRRLWAPAANSASTIDDVIVWRGFERSTLLMMCQSKQLHGVINDSPMPPPSEHCPRCATAGWLHSASADMQSIRCMPLFLTIKLSLFIHFVGVITAAVV